MTKTIKKRDYIIFIIAAVFCFFMFQHGDIKHTGGCSFGYLQGHILDFYDWDARYDIFPSYMPSTYILFAIWNIPLKLFGIVPEPMIDVPYGAIMYYKVLPVLFYIASSVVLYKICKVMDMEEDKAKICMYAFLTTPIGFYSQFIFGQYDSFTVLFVLLGIYYYLKDNRKLFVLFFGLAMTFKSFSLLVFVPLLLLKEKNVWKIVRDMVLMMVPYALELLLYMPSEVFREYVLGFSPVGYAYESSLETGFTQLSLVICVFCLICAWAYFKNVSGTLLTGQWACFFATLSCTVIFGLSKWHPQWLLFAVPFWVWGAFLHKDTKVFWFVDVLMMFFFCVFISNMYANNADQTLFSDGILGRDMYGRNVILYLGQKLQMKDLYFFDNVNLAGTVFTALMVLIACFKHPAICHVNIKGVIANAGFVLQARFLVGVMCFVLPACICYIVAVCPPYMSFGTSAAVKPVPLVEDTISQVFIATDNDVVQIDFLQGTYQRVNTVPLYVTITELETDKEVYSTVLNTKTFRDNSWVSISLEPGTLTAGRKYKLNFSIPDAMSENSVCLYRSADELGPDLYYIKSGVAQKSSICFRQYEKERIIE